VAERYRAVLVSALDEAWRARAISAANGRDAGVRNVDRLIGFLTDQLEAARSGHLPLRGRYGFALTRYMGESEWGEEGATLVALVYELQEIWSELPRD
jgi:hypothetical protein